MNVFDRDQFARVLASAKGDRSINQYGNLCDVDPGYLSRLLRGLLENPPSPTVLGKLAAHAQNGVSYEQLMQAAGILPAYEESTEDKQPVDEAMQSLLREMSGFFRMQPDLSSNEKALLIRDMREYFRFKAEQSRKKK